MLSEQAAEAAIGPADCPHTAGAQATEAASATLVAGRHVIPSANSNWIDAKLAFAAATC